MSERRLRGLKALREECLVRDCAVISLDPEPRKVDGITIHPWRSFLSALWADKILS